MKKILFYFPFDIDDVNNTSISLKSESIVNAFGSNGFITDVVYHKGKDRVVFNNEVLVPRAKLLNTPLNKIIGYYIYKGVDEIDFTDYDLIFMRYKLATPYSIKLFKKIKRENPNLRIILEYPTYPFDQEFSNPLIKSYIKYIDTWFRKRQKKYVERIVTYDQSSSILGLEAINISNGINDDLMKIGSNLEKPPLIDTLRLVGISGSLCNYHGYDRVIAGIAEYYEVLKNPEIDVQFDIIGQGKEIEVLKSQAKSLGVTDKVRFLGYMETEEISENLNDAHLAVASLGIHRIGLSVYSPLKSGFYSYAGMPIVDSPADVRFMGKEFPFRTEIPRDDSPVNISYLIQWYKELRSNYPDFRKLINKFALENFTWESQAKKILDKIGI